MPETIECAGRRPGLLGEATGIPAFRPSGDLLFVLFAPAGAGWREDAGHKFIGRHGNRASPGNRLPQLAVVGDHGNTRTGQPGEDVIGPLRRPREENAHAPASKGRAAASRPVKHDRELVTGGAGGVRQKATERVASGFEALALVSRQARVAPDHVVSVHQPPHDIAFYTTEWSDPIIGRHMHPAPG